MKEAGYQIISQDFHEAYRLLYLIRAFILKKLSTPEREELDAWLEQSDDNIDLFEQLTDEAHVEQTMALYEQMREDDALRRVKNKIPFVKQQPKPLPLAARVSVAALFIVAAGFGLYAYLRPNHAANQVAAETKMQSTPASQIMPGGNRAVLIVENGNKLVLDSIANGRFVAGTSAALQKSEGLIVYDNHQEAAGRPPVTHTLVTPNGGQYQVTLSDGTRVWLNAASSLKYSAVFAGNERTVELTGEGYFEVAHAAKPFKVKLSDYTVEDIGTAFNINAYNDGGFGETTLTEGKARIVSGSINRVLVAGQQAKISGGSVELTTGDADAVKGWMNGKFVYRFTPLDAVLKDIARWYNIKIENKHTVPSHLKATIDRNVPLDQMMKILEVAADVKLKWDGMKLTVLP